MKPIHIIDAKRSAIGRFGGAFKALTAADLAHAVLITGLAGLGHAKLGTVDYVLLGWLLLGALPGMAERLSGSGVKGRAASF